MRTIKHLLLYLNMAVTTDLRRVNSISNKAIPLRDMQMTSLINEDILFLNLIIF